MSDSSSSDAPLCLVVLCDGQPQADLPIISCSVRHALNAVPSARLVISDGDMSSQCSPLSDSALFRPGAEVEIRAGYGDQDERVFSGIVVRHGFSISGENDSRLVVECQDKACKLTLGRRSAHHVNQTDGEVIQRLIANAGLKAEVDATPITHRSLVQQACSDWDFMLARAELMGLLVEVAGGTVRVKAPDVSAKAVLTLTWGSDLIALDADIDARSQWAAVQAQGWDPAQQAVLQGASAAPLALNAQGDLDSAALAAVASPATLVLQNAATSDRGVLDRWARSVQLRAGLARIRGRMRFQGHAAARPGCLVTLAGVGQRFNGDVFVSAVEHQMQDGNWTSEATFGLDPQGPLAHPDTTAPLAGGQTPSVSGLQVGVVARLDGDPAGQGRIQVTLPGLGPGAGAVWARLLQFHASKGFGAFFPPEPGDEVLVGHLDGDPSHPVVLGSLYSSQRPGPYPLSPGNATRAIVTRSGHRVEFNDEDQGITVTTRGQNRLVLSDTDKGVLVHDQNGNRIRLGETGIALDSPKDIRLTARGGITLEATGTVAIRSQADVQASGLNIACEAQVGFSAKGSASAELSAAGQTTVKGAIVMIN